MKIEHLKKILLLVTTYPSGDNCQPFLFSWNGTVLSIYHDETRGRHSLSPANIGSIISFGALLEILDIVCRHNGYQADSKILPLGSDPLSKWAEVSFVETKSIEESLMATIPRRATDRRMYRGGNFSDAVFDLIRSENQSTPKVNVHLVGTVPEKLWRFIAQSDRLIWDHPSVVRDIVEWIRFSDQESLSTGDGMTWQSLAMKKPEVKVIELLKKNVWLRSLMRTPLRLGAVSTLKKQISSSAGIVLLTVKKDRPLQDLIDVGRRGLRIWLQLNQAEYGVQPVTLSSLWTYFASRSSYPDGIGAGLKNEISNKTLDFFKSGVSIWQESLGLASDEVPVWAFRTGKVSPYPDGMRTHRLALDAVFKDES